MKTFARFLIGAALQFSYLAAASAAAFSVHSVPLAKPPLPGGFSMDYIAFDPATGLLWAPGGNTGIVYVVDAKTEDVKTVTGFATKDVEVRGTHRTLGPTAVSIGDHVVFVGNRGDQSVCAFDPISLVKRACGQLDSMPDGVAYVAPTKEVWVTTPRDKSIRVLDATTLAEKAKLTFDGNPEGFAVDGVRHRFYTNLEDKDKTLAIDLKTRKTVATWEPKCGGDGPHGLRADSSRGMLFIACDARAEVMDVAHGGKVMSSIETGDGVDDLDYDATAHRLYIGAAKDAVLTIARVARDGKLELVEKVATQKGVRNPAAAKNGKVFLAHSGSAALNDLLVVVPSTK